MMTYLDNAATTFPKPIEVYAALDDANRNLAFNSGRGSYKKAKEASKVIQETRNLILKLFDVANEADCIFTPTATIAMNQLIGGMNIMQNATIYVSPYEHNAVMRTLALRQSHDVFHIEELPLKEDLTVDIDKAKYMFSVNPPSAVFMSAVSNVTGYILPVKEVFEQSSVYGAINILDASQAAGLLDIHMNDLYANAIVFAGHKTLYGAFGIAGFVIKGIQIEHTLAGGTGSNSLNLEMPNYMPDGFEPGSPNIVAIYGLNAAINYLNNNSHYEIVRSLTDYLVKRLQELPEVILMGFSESRNCIGIASFVIKGFNSSDVGNILDSDFDIAVRTGYHCTPLIHKYLRDESYGGTIRVSVGLFNTKEDIDNLISAIKCL